MPDQEHILLGEAALAANLITHLSVLKLSLFYPGGRASGRLISEFSVSASLQVQSVSSQGISEDHLVGTQLRSCGMAAYDLTTSRECFLPIKEFDV